MTSFDYKGIPRCTIDYPLEISSEEISSLTGPLNTLLKSSYLLTASTNMNDMLNTVFDIAEEIAGVEVCGFLLALEEDPNFWEVKTSRRVDPDRLAERSPYLVAPAVIATHFGKGISLDPDWGQWSGPICEAWSSRSLVAFPIRRDREWVGVLTFGKRNSHPFLTPQVKLLWLLCMQAENLLQREVQYKALSVYSFYDPLTHLYNRHFFIKHLDHEILRSRRTGKSFTLLLLEIDDPKGPNGSITQFDSNMALQEFAGVLFKCVRDVDMVARLESEKFAVILPESNEKGARRLTSRIAELLRGHHLPDLTGTRTVELTASAGGVVFPEDSFDREDLLGKAGQAFHAAKKQGGNRVCMFGEIQTLVPENGPTKEIPVRKIYDAARSVVDMDRFLEILLSTCMHWIDVERGSIVVRNSEGDFALRAAIGFSRNEEYLISTPTLSPGPVTAWLFKHQIPLVVSSKEDSPVNMTSRTNGYRGQSFLSIPLIHAGRMLGALHLTNRRESKPFSRDDLLRFSSLATEIGEIISEGLDFRESVRSFSLSILGTLSNALELRYSFLHGHSERVKDIAVGTGERLGLDTRTLNTLRTAGELHDIGNVGVPGKLFFKTVALNAHEMEAVRKHAFLGAKMLEDIPSMDATRQTILEHHEYFNGTGYPHGLRGEDISLTARILGLAEYYDAITSFRPHRKGMQFPEAIQVIRSGANTLFDPEVVAAFEEAVGTPKAGH